MFFFHFFAVDPLYLDPGSGSVILQIILASLLAIGVTLRVFWSRILAFFGKAPASDASQAEEEEIETPDEPHA